MSQPTEPGYYWAKLKTPSGGNFYCAGLPAELQGVRVEPEMNDDGSCAWASTQWEIVEVWENVLGGYDPQNDESLAVSVPGIPITQWPQDFYWGPRVKDAPPGATLSTTPTGDPNYRRRGSDATEALREKITSLIDEVAKTDTLSPWFGVRIESLGKFVFQNRKAILATLKGDKPTGSSDATEALREAREHLNTTSAITGNLEWKAELDDLLARIDALVKGGA